MHEVAKVLLIAGLILFCGSAASAALDNKRLGSLLGVVLGVLLLLAGSIVYLA